MPRITHCIYIIGLLLLTGCAGANSIKQDMLDHNSVLIYQGDSGSSATYLRRTESKDIICRGPYLDALKTNSEQASLGLSKLGSGESIGESESQGAVSLGGMSPDVLITSELLYRACELAANINANQEQTLKIYERFLQSVEKTATSQIKAGAAPISLQQNMIPASETQQGENNSVTSTSETDSD